MLIQEDISLKNLNTFGVDVRAKFLVVLKTFDDARRIFSMEELADERQIVIGGGSNVLFTDDFDGLIIKNEIEHFDVSGKKDSVIVEAGGGNNWDELVQKCVSENLWGIENLSLIPGNTGAAPIQNIGAYGVELKDVFDSLEALNTFNAKLTKFTSVDCRFGYRNSVFKKRLKNHFLVTKVRLRLSKKELRNTSYKALTDYLEYKEISKPSLEQIRQAVIDIRKRKLPDPAALKNAGSFFKNPILPRKYFEQVKEKWGKIVSFRVDENYEKV